MRLGILGSTRGTHLHHLVKAIQEGTLNASIEMVVSNKADALILKAAKDYGLQHAFVDPLNLSRENYDAKLSALFHSLDIELIVLIGYMRILSAAFVSDWSNKMINIHPSLLPAHAGLMDLAVHQAVLAARHKESGCTVHYVNETVDGGPIILQARCPVHDTDTPESLKSRVQALEAEVLINAINGIASIHSE